MIRLYDLPLKSSSPYKKAMAARGTPKLCKPTDLNKTETLYQTITIAGPYLSAKRARQHFKGKR